MKNFLLTLFVSIGGLGLVASLVLSYAPSYTAQGLIWLFGKFPKVKEFVHAHLKKIEEFEDAELAAVKQAEEQA